MADEQPPAPPPPPDDGVVLKINGLNETIEKILEIPTRAEQIERLAAMVTDTLTALGKDVGRLTREIEELKQNTRVCIGLLHVTMKQARFQAANITLDAVNQIHEEEVLAVEFRPEWKKWRITRQTRPGKIITPPPGFKVRGNNT